MGRLVKPQRIVTTRVLTAEVGEGELRAGEAEAEAEAKETVKEQAGDTYLERVAKYVPAEIVAFFLFANNLLKQTLADTPQGQVAKMANFDVVNIGIILFLLAWILTPVYLWRMREEGDAWKLSALLSFLLFPIWAYAIDAIGLHRVIAFDGHLASILLGVATLVSGLVRPRPESESPASAPATKTEPTIASRVRELFPKPQDKTRQRPEQRANAKADATAAAGSGTQAPTSAMPAEGRKPESEH